MKSGIYCIRNIINGKRYVGSSTSLKKRKYDHWYDFRRGDNRCGYLQRAWDHHGGEAFVFEVLEYCEPGSLLEREDWWIEHFQTRDRAKGYNICSAVRGTLGLPCSDERKRKIGAANRGKSPSPEARAKMAAAKIGTQNAAGHKLSDEWKAAHSARMKGRTITAEQRARLSAALTGKKATQATIAKRSASLKGRVITPEHRAKIAAAHKGKPGRPWSTESRAKLSQSMKGNKYSQARAVSLETRAKISAAQKANEALIQRKSAAMRGNQLGKGHQHTEEAKAKIGAASLGNQHNRGRKPSEAARAAMAAAQKQRRLREAEGATPPATTRPS